MQMIIIFIWDNCGGVCYTLRLTVIVGERTKKCIQSNRGFAGRWIFFNDGLIVMLLKYINRKEEMYIKMHY